MRQGNPEGRFKGSTIRTQRIIGIVGVATAYILIASSIFLSPWFNFYNNALSDLGNTAQHGSTAWIFNWGLIISGLLIAASVVLAALNRRSWKYLVWLVPLAAATTDLAMIGFFPETTGHTHLIVSVIFFTLIVLTMLIYSYASWPLGTPLIGGIALILGVASVVVWFVSWPWGGVALQESASAAMATLWIALVYLKNL